MNGYLIVMIIMALAIVAVVIAATSADDESAPQNRTDERDVNSDYLTEPEER